MLGGLKAANLPSWAASVHADYDVAEICAFAAVPLRFPLPDRRAKSIGRIPVWSLYYMITYMVFRNHAGAQAADGPL